VISVNDLKINILPEAAKRELFSFYEYLLFKYLKNLDSLKSTGEVNKNLDAFYRFKKLRKQLNPMVGKSIDIDKLINESNNDIF